VAGVKLQPPAGDGVVSLQHQGVFHVRVIDKFFHLREEGFDVLVYTQPDAGGVDADIGHVILLRQRPDGVSLRPEVHPAPLVALKDAELSARHGRRCHDHAPGAVAVLRSLRRVVTDPDLFPAERAQRKRFKVGPYFPAVHHARLQQREREHGRQVNAERAAKMQWERLQRGAATFSIQLAKVRAELYTEMPVKVSGFKQQIDAGGWIITTLTHSLSADSGFTTSIELEVKIDSLEME